MIKKFLKRLLLCILCILIVGIGCIFLKYVMVRKGVMDVGKAAAKEEAEWLLKLQLSDGSFACYEPEEGMSVRVNPYFSSYAALAVLKSDYEKVKKENVDAYLEWYFRHMNMSADQKGSVGTVYDYEANVEGRRVISETCTYSYDSADSYSAVYLMLLWEYVERYGDADILAAEKEKTDSLVELLLSLQSEGYTESFRGSNVKYLMNNMEVYQGMKSALKLYEKLWETDERIEKLREAVSEFEDNFEAVWWNESYYYSALNGKNQPFPDHTQNWGRLYECAVPQLFPIMFGINKPISVRSVQVYSEFCRQWNWQQMEYLGQTEGNQTWSLIVYAAMLMGDYGRAGEYLQSFKKSTDDRRYPYYSGDSVWIVLAFAK